MTTPTRIEGRCVWLREAIAPGETDCAPLMKDEWADVCIVGGGLAGLWTALNIKARKPSADVVIVEADICGGGASGRNSGMVLSQWAKFAALEDFCGTEGAIRLGQAFGNSADGTGGVLRRERHRRGVPPRRLDLGRHLREACGLLERHPGRAWRSMTSILSARSMPRRSRR